MSCRLNNISDPKLEKYIKDFGPNVGVTNYLKEISPLLQQFETDNRLSFAEVGDLNKSLEDVNFENNTKHSLSVNDGNGYVLLNSTTLNPNSSYTTKLNIDWGRSLIVNNNVLNDISMEALDEAADMEAFLRDLHGEEEFVPDNVGDILDIVVENEDFDVSDADISYFIEHFEMTGKESGVGSGIKQVVEQVVSRIKDMRDNYNKLDANKNIILQQIRNLRLSNVKDADEQIKSRMDRISAINSKMNEYKQGIRDSMADVKAVNADLTVDNLRKLFNKHREFVLKIANSNNATEGDIVMAVKTMSMWASLRNLVFDVGDNVNKKIIDGLQEIEVLASDSDITKIRAKAVELLKQGAFAELEIQLIDDFLKKRSDTTVGVDVGYHTRKAMSLAGTSIKLLSVIDGWLKRAGLRTQDEVFATNKAIKQMFKSLKAAKLSTDMFVDEDGGLIDRFTNVFHKSRQDMMEKYEKNVESVRDPKTNKYNNKRLEKIISDRNTWLKERVFIITPEDYSTPEKRAALKDKIVKHTKDAEFAEDRIVDAIMKNEQFERDLSNYSEYVEGQFSDKKLVKKKIADFIKYNSPSEYSAYINKSNIANDLRPSDGFEKYSTEIPYSEYVNKSGKVTSTGFYNETFNSKILNNPEAFKFYDQYSALIQSMLDYLPVESRRGLSKSFLPQVENEAWSKITRSGFMGIFSNVKESLIDSVTTEAGINGNYGNVDSFGKPVRRIPIRYISNVDAAIRSKDLQKIIMKFSQMAISYKHLSQVEDKVALANMVLRSMKSAERGPDGALIEKDKSVIKHSDQLVNAISMAQHAIDNVLYGNRTDIEGVMSQKFFDKKKNTIKIVGSVNPVPILDMYNNLVKTKGVEIASQLVKDRYGDDVLIINEKDAYKDLQNKMMDLGDDLDNKKITQAEYDNRIRSYEEAMRSMGKNVTISKGLDTIVQFSYLKSFAYNVFPAFANDVFGDIAVMNWASGRQDFSPKMARWALIQARKSCAMAVKTSSSDSNKALNLAIRMKVISDSSEGISESTKYDLKPFGLFGFLELGDSKNRMATMLAMLRTNTIQDINGNTRELYDAFNADGTWNVAEFGENKDWNGSVDSLEDNKSLFKFSLKVKRINQIIHGNMDPETSPEAKRHVLGRLLSQYRLSWMAEGVAARFQSRMFDEILERDNEGRYISTWKYVKANGAGKSLTTMLKLLAFQGENAFNGSKISAKDRDLIIANVRKTLHEMKYYLALWGVYLTAKAALDDEDNETTAGLKYVLLNTIYRIMGDISFYSSPSTFNQIINNPIPILGIYSDFTRFTRTIGKHLEGEEYYDNTIVFRDLVRNIPVLNMYPKWEYRTNKLLMDQVGF